MAWTGACPDAWPMRTERSARSVGIGTNALASSIVLVCRLRPESATPATRREFIATLRRELPDALKNRRRAVTYRPRCQPHRGRDRAAPSGPARSARRGDAGHRGTHAGGGAGPRGEAIYQSLRRRRERLEEQLREEEIARRGLEATAKLHTIREQDVPYLTAEDIEDLDDAPESEVERLEEREGGSTHPGGDNAALLGGDGAERPQLRALPPMVPAPRATRPRAPAGVPPPGM